MRDRKLKRGGRGAAGRCRRWRLCARIGRGGGPRRLWHSSCSSAVGGGVGSPGRQLRNSRCTRDVCRRARARRLVGGAFLACLVVRLVVPGRRRVLELRGPLFAAAAAAPPHEVVDDDDGALDEAPAAAERGAAHRRGRQPVAAAVAPAAAAPTIVVAPLPVAVRAADAALVRRRRPVARPAAASAAVVRGAPGSRAPPRPVAVRAPVARCKVTVAGGPRRPAAAAARRATGATKRRARRAAAAVGPLRAIVRAVVGQRAVGERALALWGRRAVAVTKARPLTVAVSSTLRLEPRAAATAARPAPTAVKRLLLLLLPLPVAASARAAVTRCLPSVVGRGVAVAARPPTRLRLLLRAAPASATSIPIRVPIRATAAVPLAASGPFSASWP